MFFECISLKNIEDLKYLDTKEIDSFLSMFFGCTALSNIKELENWMFQM